MLFNYFVLSLRNLRKQRVYTALNVFGLGLSIACCVLIFLLVRRHLSYDNFHPNRGRVARIVTDVHMQTISPFPGVPNPMAKTLRADYAFLEKTAMYAARDAVLISIDRGSGIPDKFQEEEARVAFTEPEIFDILHYKLLRGDLQSLSEPGTALLTERMARKYFGQTDPIGQTFRYENRLNFRVTGILQNIPENTDYKGEVLLSWITRKAYPSYPNEIDNWGGINSSTYCFALLQPGHTVSELQGIFPDLQKKHPHPDGDDLFHYKAIMMSDLHFDTDYGAGVRKSYLWALGLIGLFLLITACVNFVNMATAQALNRAREVGVRKALGSTRTQLFWQFMFETAIIVAAAMLAGLALARLALPYLNEWTDQSLRMTGAGLGSLAGFMVLLSVLLVFLAGAYPGIMQARFQPVLSLKGQAGRQQSGGMWLRRTLVTTQFIISQVLIIGAAVISSQMQYARDADWGFRPGAIVTVPIPDTSRVKMATLRQQISAISGVNNISLCYQPPASSNNSQTGVRFENRPEGEPWMVSKKPADDSYINTFGLELVAGRNIQPSDTVREYVVNETFVKKLNLGSPQEILNKQVNVDGFTAPVVGVVRDFHNWALSEPISAIAIGSNMEEYATCALELNPGNPAPVLAQVKKIWEGLYPEHYYEQVFMEERLAEFLEDESAILQLINTFAGIAVFIGCLGLYGLAAFMIARKTKEIGIRKTLGASVSNILWQFGREFARLVLIAFVVAAPLSWWSMNAWLNNYTFRISIGMQIFLYALLITAGMVVLTVSFQSIRAALSNPVKALRSE